MSSCRQTTARPSATRISGSTSAPLLCDDLADRRRGGEAEDDEDDQLAAAGAGARAATVPGSGSSPGAATGIVSHSSP